MDNSEGGFSILEMLIAMFLLAVLSLAVLPLLIGATQASATNKTVVAATTFANAKLAPIQASYPNNPTTPTSCATLRTSYAATGAAGPTGSGLSADVTIPACSTNASDYPKSVSVTVKVYRSAAPTPVIVTLPTKVMVSGP